MRHKRSGAGCIWIGKGRNKCASTSSPRRSLQSTASLVCVLRLMMIKLRLLIINVNISCAVAYSDNFVLDRHADQRREATHSRYRGFICEITIVRSMVFQSKSKWRKLQMTQSPRRTCRKWRSLFSNVLESTTYPAAVTNVMSSKAVFSSAHCKTCISCSLTTT